MGNPGIDRNIIIRWILRKWDMGVRAGSRWLRIMTGGGHVLLPLGSIKCGKILDWLKNC